METWVAEPPSVFQSLICLKNQSEPATTCAERVPFFSFKGNMSRRIGGIRGAESHNW